MAMKLTLEEKLKNIMVARNNEIELVSKQFDCVLEGDFGLTIVTGQPGIGKTFFVEHAIDALNNRDITCIYSKFGQYDKNTYRVWSEVLEQIVRFFSTLPYQSLDSIKADISKKLGSDLGIIMTICPYAQKLLGMRETVGMDSLERLKYRVTRAVYHFIAIAADALFPLVIFIDDLQWCDTQSLSIIELICEDDKYLNAFLILAYRNNEDGRVLSVLPELARKHDHILIELKELTYQDIDDYIQLIFGPNMQKKDYFVRILYGLTRGNPFHINQLIGKFLQENVISYSDTRNHWTVEFNKINNLDLSADIEQMVRKQITDLNAEERRLLELIACFGGRIEYVALQVLTGMKNDVLNCLLDGLCRASILVDQVLTDHDKDGFSYSFVHDVVYKIVYNNLDPTEKNNIHFRIAEFLAAPSTGCHTADQDDEFTVNKRLLIASHVLQVDRQLLKHRDPQKWIKELYHAGISAKQTGDIEYALNILACCEDLFFASDSAEESRLHMNIRLEIGECQFICERVEESKRSFDELIARYSGTEDLIDIKRKYIGLYACNGNFEKVLELGLEILAHLGFKFDKKQLIRDLVISRFIFRDERIDRLPYARGITERRLLIILETLTVMTPSANRLDEQMSAILALKLANISGKYGNSAYSPVAYAAYCYILFHFLKDHKKGKKLENITLEQLQHSRNPSAKSIAYCIIGAFSRHWTNPLSETVAYLEKSIDESEKGGDFLFGSYAITFSMITRYVMGTPLTEMKQYILHRRENQPRLEHYLTRSMYEIYDSHIDYLAQGIPAETGTSAETIASLATENRSGEDSNMENKLLFAATIKLNSDMIRLQRLYLEGKIKEAYGLTDEIALEVSQHRGFVLNIEYFFYSILTRIDRHIDVPDKEKKKNKKIIKKYLKELSYWVKVYRGNHYARYLLAQAEYQVLFGKKESSGKLYRVAMAFAEKQGNIPLEAIGNLLAARYYSYDKKLAGFYGQEAVRLYEKWGAFYIAGFVAVNLGLKSSPAQSPANPPAPLFEAIMVKENEFEAREINLDVHLPKIESMSEDEGYAYILGLFTQKGYVDYCAVLFEESGEMFLQYEKHKDKQAVVHKELLKISHQSNLPPKIIRYVARTETEVVIGKITHDDIFSKDRYFLDPYFMDKEKLSIACIPLKYSGVLIGIIYLEKVAEEGHWDDILSLLKAIIPSLLTKKTNIQDMDIHGIYTQPDKNTLLTDREIEVLVLVVEGLSNSDISKKLFITLGTVRNHLSNIYAKLEVNNRVKAVNKARELRIIKD